MKTPVFFYSFHNGEHFVIEAKHYGITFQVQEFDNLGDALEAETKFQEKCSAKNQKAYGARTNWNDKHYVLLAINVIKHPEIQDQAQADKAARLFRRAADWFRYAILKENKLGK